MSFAETLCTLRHARDMTQAQLAELGGCDAFANPSL